ncbi:MAG TPA: isovaleryl-CoA dehydrogenase [Ktedonobacterales bacterium]|nr:isovaleryl-CoA dehydrogenase [Ktedonobacterales bacterium]
MTTTRQTDPAQTSASPRDTFATHEVINQPPPLVGYNLYQQDAALREGVAREGAGWTEERLREIGEVAGSEEAIQWGEEANRYPPELRAYDRYGHRIDEVSFHPAWHELMRRAVGWGLHASPWREPQPGAHVARAAGFLIWSQVEAGHGCPISMTYAAIPALRVEPAVAAEWEPRFTALEYDFGLRAPQEKRGLICGMGMTEKQGGSDVRANTTRAVPDDPDGHGYRLTGHKWFCSAPMSDAFLTLAQAPGGLTCFLMPRVLPDGSRNHITIERLKDKLGNRSNASSEIELQAAWAVRIGEEGRGVRTIIEMVNATRLDCVAGSASLMRQAVAQATHHAAHRAAFGKTLIDQPLMTSVLADMALESEAATTLLLRLAAARDYAATDPREAALLRLGVAVGKFWVCKHAPTLAAEAMECLGGAGYVEESIMPRLYREAPVNAIWEGSGNVIALDVLRALHRDPATAEALLAELALARGADARLDAATDRLRRELADPADAEVRARRIVELMALTLQASLLARHAPHAVSDAFIASRLGGDWGHSYGALPPGADTRAIVERARPQVG